VASHGWHCPLASGLLPSPRRPDSRTMLHCNGDRCVADKVSRRLLFTDQAHSQNTPAILFTYHRIDKKLAIADIMPSPCTLIVRFEVITSAVTATQSLSSCVCNESFSLMSFFYYPWTRTFIGSIDARIQKILRHQLRHCFPLDPCDPILGTVRLYRILQAGCLHLLLSI
jgi:hypothetical protein